MLPPRTPTFPLPWRPPELCSSLKSMKVCRKFLGNDSQHLFPPAGFIDGQGLTLHTFSPFLFLWNYHDPLPRMNNKPWNLTKLKQSQMIKGFRGVFTEGRVQPYQKCSTLRKSIVWHFTARGEKYFIIFWTYDLDLELLVEPLPHGSQGGVPEGWTNNMHAVLQGLSSRALM